MKLDKYFYILVKYKMSIDEDEEVKLQKKINTILQKYSTKQNFYISFLYLCRDIFISYLFTAFMCSTKSVLYFPLWWIIYSLGQGTIWIGIWVLGHECGHGAFSKNKTINDVFGICIHSFLLVPYYSWQYSHKKHHKYTNHLTLGESHVPPLKKNIQSTYKKIIYYLGEDGFSIYYTFLRLILGWPLYLIYNRSGGRTDYNGNRLDKTKTKSHFIPNSQIFPPEMYYNVIISDIFIIFFLSSLLYIDFLYGFGTSMQWYFGPYVITNCWLVLYTYLQHTSENIPHYGEDKFTWLKGALSTIDRPYPFIIDEMHHYIGSTHIVHHLNYRIPFYVAKDATKEIKLLLKDKYNYNNTNIVTSLFKTTKECLFVNSLEGCQYYSNKF